MELDADNRKGGFRMSELKTQWWEHASLHKDLERNTEMLNEILGVGQSFDMICRPMTYGKKHAPSILWTVL